MSTRREFLGCCTAASLALLRKVYGDSWPAPRSGLPEAEFFAAVDMPARVTGTSAIVHAVSAGTLAETFRVRVRRALHPWELDDTPNVSEIISVSGALEPIIVPLTGLTPNTHYYYLMQYERPDEPGVWQNMSTYGQFQTQRPPGEAFTFCCFADGHWSNTGWDGTNTRSWNNHQCVARMAQDPPYDFCIDLGDSALPDSARNFPDALVMYLNYRQVMSPVTRRMPLYYVLGNHEREAGFYQRGEQYQRSGSMQLPNGLGPLEFMQKWMTDARLRMLPNPSWDTYPEGGEGAPGYDSAADWGAGTDPWNNGTNTNLQNFFAWTWGDALFVVLDPLRYTLPGSTDVPNSPAQWTLGPTQRRWLEDTLANSNAKWKFVVAHHLVGGGWINPLGYLLTPGNHGDHCYGRGNAGNADDPITEHAQIHQLMIQHGVKFFLYGHDHSFCHSVKDGVHYICCGKPDRINNWYAHNGMRAFYGNPVLLGRDKEWVRTLHLILGYPRFHVSPDRVVMEWVRTSFSFYPGPISYETGEPLRDYRESWLGRQYPVESPTSVRVTLPPTDVDAVRTVSGAQVTSIFQAPTSPNYYQQPWPPRPEPFADTLVPILPFPEQIAVVDTVPEVVYRVVWGGSDFDLDGQVDLNDFSTFANCFGSNVQAPLPGCAPADAAKTDLSGDGVIDLNDFARFAQDFTG